MDESPRESMGSHQPPNLTPVEQLEQEIRSLRMIHGTRQELEQVTQRAKEALDRYYAQRPTIRTAVREVFQQNPKHKRERSVNTASNANSNSVKSNAVSRPPPNKSMRR
jgi:hypothetical protein